MERPAIVPNDVLEIMLKRDQFTRWLGLQIDSIGRGYCKLHYQVTDTMLNGFGMVHGGVLFSAADSAFAFACNSHGILTVALDVTISFIRPVRSGELLTVEAREDHLGNRVGVYDIRTSNEKGELVAIFKGTAYRTGKPVQ